MAAAILFLLSVVRVLVEMLAPYKGRVCDPCCGSSGMFVSSEKFITAHSGRIGDIAIYGQESNYTTWRLAKMNLAIRGISCNLGKENADSFHHDLHPDLKADFILAIGDDRTDEDLFCALPPTAYSVRVGLAQTAARYVLGNHTVVRRLLRKLLEGPVSTIRHEADLVQKLVTLPRRIADRPAPRKLRPRRLPPKGPCSCQ